MVLKHAIPLSEVLQRGGDVLKGAGDFTLVGRDQELAELSTVLMKMKKRNLIVTGRGGVGISSIVLGIQHSKKDHRTPVEIVGKRLFWLNTDKLFESGAHQVINDLFERVRQTLAKTKDTILVLEDAVDFIKAAQNSGCMNLINGLMGDLKSGKYQAIFEAKDDSLGDVLKCDGDIQEFCTLYEVKEPTAENLRLILIESVKQLEQHHGIRIAKSAIETAAVLTEKYRLPELRAQPDAAVSLLDRALTDYCRQAHAFPQHIQQLKEKASAIEAAIGGGVIREDLAVLSKPELKSLYDETLRKVAEADEAWMARQREIRNLYKDMSDGDEEIRKLEDEIELIREIQIEKAAKVEQGEASSGYQPADRREFGTFASMMANVNMDTTEISAIKTKIEKLETLVASARNGYQEKIAGIYAGLSIEESHVLRSFSVISGIPVDRLNEDERVKLRNLDQILSQRVIGQEEPTNEIAKAVKRARVGLKMPNKPSGTFMFLGPSGVGKTELAKALAEALGVPLLRFDMSEYMEKHAVAKLIGAPPGYEGYEHGGILTNQARRNPYSVVLFDEIEKAHPDVFNLMLQLLDDARLTDSRGLTASFKDAIIIMTTNIGTSNFLDEGIEFDEAKERALAELREQYRPEFLGRFGGNIYCFQRLGLPVLEAIATKDLARINALVVGQGFEISMARSDLLKMIEDRYVVREGARSILGYIDRNITSGIADVVLGDTPVRGIVEVRYSAGGKIEFVPGAQDASSGTGSASPSREG